MISRLTDGPFWQAVTGDGRGWYLVVDYVRQGVARRSASATVRRRRYRAAVLMPVPGRRRPSACGRTAPDGVEPASAAGEGCLAVRSTASCDVDRYPTRTTAVRGHQLLKHVTAVINHTPQ